MSKQSKWTHSQQREQARFPQFLLANRLSFCFQKISGNLENWPNDSQVVLGVKITK